VRIDSGDLPSLVADVRRQLDSLGATRTRITVTQRSSTSTRSRALRGAPVDSYGVGTSVVTGSGHPACGMVFKLVAHKDDAGQWVSVAKALSGQGHHRWPQAAGAASAGRSRGRGDDLRRGASRRHSDATCSSSSSPIGDFQSPVSSSRTGWRIAREQHAKSIAELAPDALRLGRGDPAIETVYV
jgi:nicotinate phosphoribosyltransferase